MVDEAGLPTRGPAAVRQRRQAVIALTVFCWLFFIGAIAASYVIALAHGYGTGFGDGRLLPAGTGADKGGTGFLGDAAILFGTLILDFGLLFVWQWLMTRLDGASEDDPLPAPDGADLSQEDNWYYVYSPGLMKMFAAVVVLRTHRDGTAESFLQRGETGRIRSRLVTFVAVIGYIQSPFSCHSYRQCCQRRTRAHGRRIRLTSSMTCATTTQGLPRRIHVINDTQSPRSGTPRRDR